jgi:Holliday junction resolvasome RuvABC endonuclease subunit
MIVAGIDYSMTTPAMCIYDDSKGAMSFDKCEIFYLTQTKKYETRFKNVVGQYFEYKDSMDRYDIISSYFIDRILEREITQVYIEDYSLGSKGKVFHIAENTGVLKYRLWNFQVDVIGVPPTVIKKFATGKGNSDKEKMQTAFKVQNDIDLKYELKMTEKQWNPSSDIIDAYWICKYGYQQIMENRHEEV